ncbi:MAG: hypothetical protein JO341_13520 [Gammaproteobacteria bacterium]|nr:hypothetical protein [Gammaproteobacteria bacterium]MBV9622023.1 hypothetical protein [Gammaproteobacteria bacterium]
MAVRSRFLILLALLLGAPCLALGTEAPAGGEAAGPVTPVSLPGTAGSVPIVSVRPTYGPPGDITDIPSDEELEAQHAVIGQVFIDNQNIFDLNDPKDDTRLFRLANHVHIKTRARVVREQLLIRPGDPFDRRLIEESARLLRAATYFYDAWITIVRVHDNKVDLRVTTRDVWTLNPGFNFGRSGGTNSTGAKIEEENLLGTGIGLKLSHEKNVDRSGSTIEVSDRTAFGGHTLVDVNYSNLSDGALREVLVTRPFYALDTRWAASGAAVDDTRIDPIYDRGRLVDQFRDRHELLQAFYGWSRGLQDGWARRWTAGMAFDEHIFDPVSNHSGTTNLIPQNRRFLYPFVEYDLVQDDYLKLWNHDQIGRTEDFELGGTASLQLGYAHAGVGSTRSAVLIKSSAAKGFKDGGTSTLLLYSDFSGRLEGAALRNGVLDASVRYYVEQSKNWLFFSTFNATKGFALDLDNQILLGGDNGLRGYPLRYQDGTARALVTVEQRYFTDWYPFRLFRVGGAIFFDMGRTWGQPPLAQPSLGMLKDAGFGLRFGNARSGLGNVIHVDLAFPFNGDRNISRVQFLVQTEQSF